MQPIPRNLIFTLVLLWMGHFFVDFMIGVWPIYKTMAHLDLAKAGLISAACAFIGEGLQVVFGTLSDRGYRNLLIILGIFASAANCFLAFTDHYLLIFCLFLTVCVGSGAFHPSAIALVGNMMPSRRGFLITLFASGGSIGFGLSQLIYTAAHEYFESNTAWLFLPFIGMTLWIAYGLASVPQISSDTSHAKVSLKQYMSLFRDPNMRNLYIAQVCNQAILWAFIFLLPDVLVGREYESWISHGSGHLVLILGSAFFLLPGGYLADKYSARNVMLYATIISSLFFYTFLLNPNMSIPVLFLVLFMTGASMGLVNPVLLSYGIRLMPDKPGTVSAFLLGLAWCLSEGLGQGGGGLLTKLFVEDAPAKALMILGGLSLGSLWAILRLPVDVKTPAKIVDDS